MVLQINKTCTCLKKKLNERSKKKKKKKKEEEAIPTKGLTKDLIKNLVFLMEQNIFLQEYFKII